MLFHYAMFHTGSFINAAEKNVGSTIKLFSYRKEQLV